MNVDIPYLIIGVRRIQRHLEFNISVLNSNRGGGAVRYFNMLIRRIFFFTGQVQSEKAVRSAVAVGYWVQNKVIIQIQNLIDGHTRSTHCAVIKLKH